MRITKEQLLFAGLYGSELAAFAKEWPDGCDLSEAALVRAQELGLGAAVFAKLMSNGQLDYLAARMGKAREAKMEMIAIAEEHKRLTDHAAELEYQGSRRAADAELAAAERRAVLEILGQA